MLVDGWYGQVTPVEFPPWLLELMGSSDAPAENPWVWDLWVRGGRIETVDLFEGSLLTLEKREDSASRSRKPCSATPKVS